MSFDDPFRLRVARAITSALKEITPANDYTIDLADFDRGDGVDQSRVFRGRPWFADNDPIPMVSILEWDEGDFDSGFSPDNSAATCDWPLMVQGFVNDDPLNPTDPAYHLAAQVIKRLMVERVRKAPGTHQPDPFGMGVTGSNRILSIRIGRPVVRPADDVSAKAYFWLKLTLELAEGGDAYA